MLRLDITPRLEFPDEWRRQGEGLLACSEVLWGHVERSTIPGMAMGAASLLGGYALENLLKGLRVRQIREAGGTARRKGKLVRELSGHDLAALADDAGVVLASHERFLLKRLTNTIAWGGRYVAPKKSGESDSAVMIGNDRETIRMFAWRLAELLDGNEAVRNLYDLKVD